MKKKKSIRKLIVLVAFLFVVSCLLKEGNFTSETVLALLPHTKWMALFLLLLFYAIKSIIVFFPLIVLEIVVGHFFSPFFAIVVNLFGLSVVLTIPYFIGKSAGIDFVKDLSEKYPKVEDIMKKQKGNESFLCFFLRLVGGLPGDIVTMYFGATNVSYFKNLILGLFGLFPGMLLATLIGNTIRNPYAKEFWIAAVLKIVLAIVSLVSYRIYCKKLDVK